jgi:hypothetical protein
VWGGSRRSRRNVPTLHFLLEKRCINDFGLADVTDSMKIRWLTKFLGVRIPDFNDIESTFRANGKTIDPIFGGGYDIEH